MLKLRSLTIEDANRYYPDKPPKFTAQIEYTGDKGKVTVALDADACGRLFPLIADAIVAASRDVAEQLTAEALASKPPETMRIA